MKTLAIFLTCFLACCCAIVTVPIVGWYVSATHARQCVVKNAEAASELDSVSAQLAAMRVEPECGDATDARHYKWFFQAVTLLECRSEGWYAVTTIAGQETPSVKPVTRSSWIMHAFFAGVNDDCW